MWTLLTNDMILNFTRVEKTEEWQSYTEDNKDHNKMNIWYGTPHFLMRHI